jgi:hypothetical protein
VVCGPWSGAKRRLAVLHTMAAASAPDVAVEG